jgi:hypothetical protein
LKIFVNVKDRSSWAAENAAVKQVLRAAGLSDRSVN